MGFCHIIINSKQCIIIMFKGVSVCDNHKREGSMEGRVICCNITHRCTKQQHFKLTIVGGLFPLLKVPPQIRLLDWLFDGVLVVKYCLWHLLVIVSFYFFSRNVKIVSIRNITPLINETAPFVIARSRVRVRKACSHAWIINTPDTRNKPLPIKL